MFKVYKTLLCVLTGVTLALCYCPSNKMCSIGECSYQITCFGTIRDVRLEDKCLEATNNPAVVRVNLNDAAERFDENIDTDFLDRITNLKISAKWKETTLAILQHTSRLKTLNLVDVGLEKISGSPFYYLSRLEEINLSYNKLTDVEDLFQFVQPNTLKRLLLAYNAIEDLSSPYPFETLNSLVELDLSYNLISDLTEEPFSNLTSLQILRLNNNRIKDLNGAVNNLHNLKHLYLRGNQIQNIDDESLKIIEHLETFDVSSNELEKIKPIMFSRHWAHFGNHSTCTIILSENHINSVPNGTSKEISDRYVRNLDSHSAYMHTELDLSANSISSVEYNAFQSLIRLVSLDLSRNKIIDFIVNSEDLTHVQYLNLSSNYISQLYYESFSSMNNLHNFDLSYNRMDFIPDMTFNNNYNLKLLNMSYNVIEKLERIHITIFHPKGGILDLSNNELSKLTVPYGEGLRLIELKLHSNNILEPSLVDLRHQTELKVLDMSKNFITELNVSSLFLPASLEKLDMSSNRINSIGPSTFHILKHLKTLRLDRNQLALFEYGAFQGLVALQELNLSYNRIGFLYSQLLTEMKSLKVMYIISNGLNALDYKSWYGHNFVLDVFVDDNNLSCDWLRKALSDFNNGFSKMRPVALVPTRSLHSVEGIPCSADQNAAYTASNTLEADERLLLITQNILKAIRQQNYYLWNIMKYSLHNETAKPKILT